MGRAADLKSGGPGFKSRSDRKLELFLSSSEFNSSATLVNSQLICLLSVGIFNRLSLIWIILFVFHYFGVVTVN